MHTSYTKIFTENFVYKANYNYNWLALIYVFFEKKSLNPFLGCWGQKTIKVQISSNSKVSSVSSKVTSWTQKGHSYFWQINEKNKNYSSAM